MKGRKIPGSESCHKYERLPLKWLQEYFPKLYQDSKEGLRHSAGLYQVNNRASPIMMIIYKQLDYRNDIILFIQNELKEYIIQKNRYNRFVYY